MACYQNYTSFQKQRLDKTILKIIDHCETLFVVMVFLKRILEIQDENGVDRCKIAQFQKSAVHQHYQLHCTAVQNIKGFG
jgi:hypothetical protein